MAGVNCSGIGTVAPGALLETCTGVRYSVKNSGVIISKSLAGETAPVVFVIELVLAGSSALRLFVPETPFNTHKAEGTKNRAGISVEAGWDSRLKLLTAAGGLLVSVVALVSLSKGGNVEGCHGYTV
jgi:hypothetical protein